MSTPYAAPPNGFRTFLIVWSTQSISVLGSALTGFALTIWLTTVQYPRAAQKPALALALVALSLAGFVPALVGAPIAGAWADRHDRKQTMMVCDLLNGLLSLTFLALVVGGALNLVLLVPLVIVGGLLGAFHGAAFDTSYAMIVPEEQLPRANGMMQTIWALSGVVSPAIAATIISLPLLARQGALPGALGATLSRLRDGTPLAMGIDALTFFGAAVTLLFLSIPSPRHADAANPGAPRPSLWADVRVGALYIWQRRPILWLLGTFTVANFASAPVQTFEALIVKFNLARDWSSHGLKLATALAILASVGSVGGVCGGVLISAWGGLKTRRIYGVLAPMIVAGLAQIIFGLSSWLYLSAAMAFIMAAMTPILNAHSQAIWQAQTPRELQGRVFAVRRVIAQFSFPVSTLLAGMATGLFNPGAVIAVLGAVYAIFCVAQLFNRALRRVEDKAYRDSLAITAATRAEERGIA